MIRLFVAAVALALIAPRLAAQVCLGHAPFAVGPARVGGGVAGPPDGKLYTAEIGIGTVRSVFGSMDISHAIADESDVKTTSVGLRVGRQVSASSGVWQVCPMLGVGHLFISARSGLNVGDTVIVQKESGWQYDLGGAAGARWPATETLDLLPSLALQYVGSRVAGTVRTNGVTTEDTDRLHSHGVATVSLGFLMDRRLTIHPFVAVPFGAPGSEVYFGFGASLSVGPQAR